MTATRLALRGPVVITVNKTAVYTTYKLTYLQLINQNPFLLFPQPDNYPRSCTSTLANASRKLVLMLFNLEKVGKIT
ncbi:hypothetical protein EJB05_34727, partial [Eragrostis curvula]